MYYTFAEKGNFYLYTAGNEQSSNLDYEEFG